MRSGARRFAAASALAPAAVACEEKDQDFAGTYSGDGIDSQNSSNRKEFTLTLAASGTTVAGTFRIRAILVDSSGIVAGTLTGSSEVSLTLTPSNADCPYRVNGTWSGDRITGSYAAFNCFVRSDGTLNLKK
jgi:hypothetical protein